MNKALIALLTLAFVVLPGCREADLALTPAQATIGYTTAVHDELISLPEPEQKVIVAVYKFRDQTGQYKTSAQATTFSTAVTQGATSMLNKALEDSGWFTPIERESLANLLNERKIITSTRMQAQASGGPKLPALPPLLYAGVLLEGGIIGYDTNLVTGGLGVRYFGVGGSGQIRKDRVTIYLRLISVQNGQVLKSISTTKSVLSKEVDFGLYRYVSVKRLLEVETGLSTNEPVTMCVLEAIEKGVHDLIIEGIQDGLWNLKNQQDINSPVIQSYLEEKRRLEKVVTLDKKGRPVAVSETDEVKPTVAPVQKTVRETLTENEHLEEPDDQNIDGTRVLVSETAVIRVNPETGEKVEPGRSTVEQDKDKSAAMFLQEAINSLRSGIDDEDKIVVPEGGT